MITIKTKIVKFIGPEVEKRKRKLGKCMLLTCVNGSYFCREKDNIYFKRSIWVSGTYWVAQATEK